MGRASKLMVAAVATTIVSGCGDNRANKVPDDAEVLGPRLTRLEISRGTLAPNFASDVLEYQVRAPITIADVTLVAEASPADAIITVEGVPVMAGVPTMEIPLDLGNNAVHVKVTTVGGLASETYVVNVNRAATLTYVKASNTYTFDGFGVVALSGDGSTLAVGAIGEDSGATGVDGDQGDTADSAGAVYVFRRSGTSWSQEAYVKASNTDASDLFGYAVALSADGSTLVVGAVGEDSAATGIDGNQADNSVASAGAVYVFRRNGPSWSQEAYVKASNTGAGDNFGQTIALSDDGSMLAVGAQDDSGATGIDGNQSDDSATDAGAVFVFRRNGTSWSQEAYVKASNTGSTDLFGSRVALSGDGSTLAVGAFQEDSAATGINGSQTDNAPDAGAVYVFRRSASSWSQETYVKASNTDASDIFGDAVALSADGSTLVVGAGGEDSAATGIDGDEADNSKSGAGAAYVFRRIGTTWSQSAYVKSSNPDAGDRFGSSMALSKDGSTLAVGAFLEASAATGVGGNQANNNAFGAGAVYVFQRSKTSWKQAGYLKASNAQADDYFGSAIALSADGTTLAASAYEDSSATGIGGNQADNSADHAGAVYLFE